MKIKTLADVLPKKKKKEQEDKEDTVQKAAWADPKVWAKKPKHK